jgi:sortase A
VTTTAQHRAETSDQPGRPRRRRPSRRPLGATLVGLVGEVLITLGVLLGLFVVWQLWWTDVTVGQVQEQVVADLGWACTADQRPTPAPDGPEERRDEAPVLEAPAEGTTFATLSVPRWGPDYLQPITEGVSRSEVLDVLGLGHYPGTAMPGQVGNFAVAGHRVTYGKPLNRVEELQVGDALDHWIPTADGVPTA